MLDTPIAPLTRAQSRRLREIWRSAGWPCQDMLEAELLAAGLLEQLRDAAGRETLKLTSAGIRALAASHQRNRAALSAHEALVERIAIEMVRAGRIVWRGLALRAPLTGTDGTVVWQIAMPDVYSIRHTSVERRLEPIVHEIKVSRSDLLSDLRRPAKRLAYRALASECWYVVRDGIAGPADIPEECGVLVAAGSALEVARPAPKRALKLPFGVWMALARAAPVNAADSVDSQLGLGAQAFDESAT